MKEYRVLVQNAGSLPQLANVVATFMDSPLSPFDVNDGTLFRGYVELCMIDVLEDHGLMDDAGIPFTQYRFEIVLEALEALDDGPERIPTKPKVVDIEQKAVDLAREICGKLSTRCMVVRGLQNLIFTC